MAAPVGAFWRFLAHLGRKPPPIFNARNELGPKREFEGTFGTLAPLRSLNSLVLITKITHRRKPQPSEMVESASAAMAR